MSIQVIRSSEKLPQADVRFRVCFLKKPVGRRRLQTHTELYGDEDGEPLNERETTILAVANYIEHNYDEHEDVGMLREEEPDQYRYEPISATISTVKDSRQEYLVKYSLDPVPDTGDESERFDPSRGAFRMDAGFCETVLKLIREKGISEADCYNKAGITRMAFQKIRQKARHPENPYRPSKQTAMALAVALELNHEDAKKLLECAGYSFSHSSKADIIVEYFLIHGKYDIMEINDMLYQYDQPLLGSV